MKIGIMLRHLNELGGIVVYTKNIIENLFQIDKDNQYVLIYDNDALIGTYASYPNVSEVVLKISNKLLWDQYGVPKVIKKEKIDIIFNPKLSVPVFTKAKTVLTMHGLEQFAVPEVFKKIDRMYFTIMMPVYCRSANAIISMTETGKKDMVKYLGAKPQKIHVINESYHKRFCVIDDNTYLSKIKKKYNLPDRYILFVGGLTPLKNFSNILKGLKDLKERKKLDIKLVSVGFKRWKFQKDIDLVKDLGLENEIIFPGFVLDEELPAFYNMASCLVFPSLYEGFGIPVIEAQASGCPVITSKTGCAPEVSGGAAVLADPYNYKEISDGIYRSITDDSFRKELITSGLDNAKRYSRKKTAKKTLELFEQLEKNKL